MLIGVLIGIIILLGLIIGYLIKFHNENRRTLKGIESRLSDLQDRLTDR